MSEKDIRKAIKTLLINNILTIDEITKIKYRVETNSEHSVDDGDMHKIAINEALEHTQILIDFNIERERKTYESGEGVIDSDLEIYKTIRKALLGYGCKNE